MIRKRGYRFSEKIMLKQKDGSGTTTSPHSEDAATTRAVTHNETRLGLLNG
jgi:DNA-binding winged helix-turn-helix (wHTH) protein